MNLLITGGAGFIGSSILEYCIKEKLFNKIRILDNLSTGHKYNIEEFMIYERVEFIYGDISDLEICRKAMKDIDLVCNQAALGSVPRSVNDPLSSHISNVNGFLNILIAMKENNVKRIVYASSSSVYGDEPNLPKIEEKTGHVLSPYAATKKINEIYARVFNKCYGIECIGLRYFNVFGPRQDPNGAYAAVIPKFIKLMKNNKFPTINGDGTYSRDFTYIDNVIQANLLALSTEEPLCYGEVFNIGAGGRITIGEMSEIIKKELNYTGDILYGKNREGDIPHSNASISKANLLLKYYPKIDFQTGIKKLLEY